MRLRVPLILLAVIAVGTVVTLRLMGRIGWCECGRPTVGTTAAWSEHTSQHLLDPYVCSHILHGVIFYFALRWGWLKRHWPWALVIAAGIEAAWEVVENTPLVINRYRDATAALGYNGDSIANSMTDWLAALAGFLLARWLGGWKSLALFLLLELGCLFWIRDNLTLNVVMLLYPIDAIARWQSGA